MSAPTVLQLDMRAPELNPWPSTLLDVAPAQLDPSLGLRFLGDTGQYLSGACLVPELGGFCGPMDEGVEKELNGLATSTTASFSVHALVSCKAPGVTDILRPELDRVWSVGVETMGVERGLVQEVFATSATTDITAFFGVAIASIADAIAALEGYAALNYAGLPILHLPIPLVVLGLKEDVLVRDSNLLRTKLGSVVVAGRGYLSDTGLSVAPTGTAAGAGDYWAWVTGGLSVRAGNLRTVTEFDAPAISPGSSNEYTALSERSYGITLDCLIAGLHFQALTASGG